MEEAITPPLAADGREKDRQRLTHLLLPAGLFAAVLGLYAGTMTPGLGGGIDSAEFQHAAHDLSIVHPTGYPLYLLLARAFLTLFPIGEVAWRVTLLSALFCAAAVVVVYAIVVLLARSRPAGLFAAGLAATHPLVWGQATVAEVNSLNLLLVAGVFYSLLRWANGHEARRGWPLELSGLLFGLALTNHRVSLFALPGMLIFVLWAARAGAHLSPALAARTAAMILVPLPLYFYIPVRAGTTAWYTNSWESFWNVAGGESAWPVIRDTLERPLLPRVRIVLAAIFGELNRAALFAGRLNGLLHLLGLGAVLMAIPAGGFDPLARRAAIALFAPAALVVSAVMVVYDVDVIGDYLSMAVMILAILSGLGAAAAARATSRARRRSAKARGRDASAGPPAAPARLAYYAIWCLLLAGLAWGAWVIRPQMDRSADRAARAFWDALRLWEGTPAALPQGALLISPWNRYNELRYLQSVEAWRPDLQPVVLDDLVAGGRLRLIDEWLAQGRPVYLLEGTPDVLDFFTAEQREPLWRITARGQAAEVAMENRLDVRFGDSITLLGYTLQPRSVSAGGQLKITLFWRAEARIQERYVVFTHLVDAQQRKIGQKDDEPGRGYRPTVNWPPGQAVVDSLLMPIDPAAPPGRYRLMAGLYTRIGERRLPATGPAGEPLGDYWQMAEVEVTR